MTAIVTKNTFFDFDGHGNVFMKALNFNDLINQSYDTYDDDCYKEHFL